MAPTDEASASTTAGEAAVGGTNQSHGHQASHPHHLKWGDVAVSGFAPPSEGEAEDEEMVEGADGCARTKWGKKAVSVEEHRRKLSRDRSMELLDAETRRIHGARRYLVRKPRALQYFRGKTLVRSDEERSSARLELFFDLTFVGIIAVLAEEVIADPTGASLVRYLITYSAAFLVWSWMREIFNAFYKDDLSQRFLVLFVMACLIVYGNNAPSAQKSRQEGSARAAAVGSYLLAEAAIFVTFFIYSFHIKPYRAQLRAHTLAWLCSSAIWIGLIFVNDIRGAIAMAVVALALEYGAWVFVYTPVFKKMMRLRYSSALAIDHEIERFSDFITIVMGEFLFSVFSQNPAGTGVKISAGRAVMAVILAFCFQLLYMQGCGSKRIDHPIRYKVERGIAFFTLHLPIVCALTLCGDSMADFVRESHVESAVRWIACETYAIGMIGMWCLATLEHSKDAKGELWLPKWARLVPRLLAGIIAIFLPLTHQLEPSEEGENTMEGAAGEESAALTLTHVVRTIVTESTKEFVSRAEAEPAGEPSSAEVSSEGPDITTTKLLGILTCLSVLALLWEMVTSLDGPNAPHESASQDLLDRAEDGHTTKAALATPRWRGYPALFEPGAGTIDRSHQREQESDTMTDSSAISPARTMDSASTQV